MRVARYTGILLAVLLIVAGFLHQNIAGFETDRTLFYISIVFAVIHFAVFGLRLNRAEPTNDGEPVNPLEKRF
jgi:APA family basic amino acid/polyamine antiporter